MSLSGCAAEEASGTAHMTSPALSQDESGGMGRTLVVGKPVLSGKLLRLRDKVSLVVLNNAGVV